mmetsp:Transcript_65492/g.156504  ORF Transcript_65492/g.156504 Transcript_65492/m.156504 type:complete len:224 (-) Transcript_65492:364-1035(-)
MVTRPTGGGGDPLLPRQRRGSRHVLPLRAAYAGPVQDERLGSRVPRVWPAARHLTVLRGCAEGGCADRLPLHPGRAESRVRAGHPVWSVCRLRAHGLLGKQVPRGRPHPGRRLRLGPRGGQVFGGSLCGECSGGALPKHCADRQRVMPHPLHPWREGQPGSALAFRGALQAVPRPEVADHPPRHGAQHQPLHGCSVPRGAGDQLLWPPRIPTGVASADAQPLL